MRFPPRRPRDYADLLDLALIGVAAGVAVSGLAILAIRFPDGHNPLNDFLVAPTFAALVAVWLPLRMAQRLGALASVPLRQEIWMTGLPASDYLAPRLRAPIVRVLAPWWLAAPLAVAGELALNRHIYNPEWDYRFQALSWTAGIWQQVLIILQFFAIGILATGFSAAGTLDGFVRLCRPGWGGRSWLAYAAPAVWIAGGVGAMAGAMWGMYTQVLDPWLYSGRVYSAGQYVYRMIVGNGAVLLMIVVLARIGWSLAINRWRAACAAFYRFE
ncbi:MAG: hypothetical protein NTW86_16680 [Candidatus Sumerlaeota bacterium]|nr:hypothetical protein [Candidatus Sumerlaeota bacterium]